MPTSALSADRGKGRCGHRPLRMKSPNPNLAFPPAAPHRLSGGGLVGKGRTLIRGTLLLTLSGLALRGLGVLFQALLAKRAGAAGMGLLQLVLTVGGFAGTLGSAGVRVAALQLAARAWGRGDRPGITAALLACLRCGLLASTAAGAALILLAAPLSEVLLRDGRTAPALRTLGLLLPLPILAGILRSVYTACGRVKELVAAELTERL